MSAKNPHGLTDQQYKFCVIYLSDPEKNITNAYKGAYPKASQKSCESAGSRLLENVRIKAYLNAQRAKDEKKDGASREYVLNKLMELAEFGTKQVEIKDSKGKVIRTKLQDTAAGTKGVELLGKHFKMFTDKVEHSGEIKHTGVLRIGGELSMEEWLAATGASAVKEES